MKTMFKRIVLLALLSIFILSGCSFDTNNDTKKDEGIKKQTEEKTSSDSDKVKDIIKDRSTSILKNLKDFDTDKLAKYVHPKKGLRFSPYTYIESTDIVFSKSEVAKLNDNSKKYMWGKYDGSGFNIIITSKEYFDEFVYDIDYLENSDEIGYNEVVSTPKEEGNQYEIYTNPIVVEYFYKGTEEANYFDWKSLRLVFEKYEDEWYLVGLIHSEKTI